VQVWLVDPRRALIDVLGSSNVHRYASTPATVKQRMVELAAALAARLPDDDPDGHGQLQRGRWQGPEIFLVIDDAERMPPGYDSPFEPIAQFVQAGADVGLHIIYTHSFGPFMTGLGTDVVLRNLRLAYAPMLIMDSDGDPGFVKGKWKGHPMVPGRGFLLDSAQWGEAGVYVQVADTQLVRNVQH
jgi:hypothetical protein